MANALPQIKSLEKKPKKEEDDLETSICKRVSWILRRGASKVGVKVDPRTGWVKLSDLCACDILKEHSEELIWKVIIEFNAKKVRYQIIDDQDGRRVRASKRETTDEVAETPMSALQQPQDPQQVPSAQQMYDPQQAAQFSQQFAWNYAWPMMTPWMNPYMWQASSVPFRGRIKSINAEKGFGFIENTYIFSQYQRDVFLRKDQLGDLQVGDWVQFSFELNKQRWPQAKEVVSMASMYNMQPPASPAVGKGKDGSAKGKGGKGRGKGGGKKGKGDGGEKSDKGDKNKKDKLEQGVEGATDSAGQTVAREEGGSATEAAS